jgi:hypothetical protein
VSLGTPQRSSSSPVPSGAADAVPRGLLRWALTGGGTAGNEQLTATVGVVLIVLLAVLGVTIVRIGQLLDLHLFLGLVLIGPVAAKLASTGYRFARYYTHEPAYRRKGPPLPALRLLAPFVVGTTLVVFVTGVLLLLDGPSDRSLLVLVHKVSFFVWLAATGLHVLGHLAEMPGSLRAVKREGNGALVPRGDAGRWITIGGSLVGGLVLAIALLPYFGAWSQGLRH